MSTVEGDAMHFTPQEAEWLMNYGSQYGGTGMDVAREVSRAAREIAARYISEELLEGVPETLQDCLNADAMIAGKASRYADTTLKMREALQKNYREVSVPMDEERCAAIGLMVTIRREQLAKEELTKENIRSVGLELVAVKGIDFKLMNRFGEQAAPETMV